VRSEVVTASELTRVSTFDVVARHERAAALLGSALLVLLAQFHHAASDAQRQAAIEKLDEVRRALYLILAD